MNRNCTCAKPGEDEVAFADKLYMTGNRCLFAHIFSFIRLEFCHFSAMSRAVVEQFNPLDMMIINGHA
jgi:hypothetical protein